MAKARMYGMKTSYVPNSKADMRFRKNIYQRGREIAERDPIESRTIRQELKQMEKAKADG